MGPLNGSGTWPRSISRGRGVAGYLARRRAPGGRGRKAACGAGEEAGRQAERGKLRLLADGYCGVVEWVGELTATGALGGDGAALGGVANYFAGHQGRLNFKPRRG